MTGCCEWGNVTPSSKKCGEFLYRLRNLLVLRKNSAQVELRFFRYIYIYIYIYVCVCVCVCVCVVLSIKERKQLKFAV